MIDMYQQAALLNAKIELEALVAEREAWVARRALYEARTAEGNIMEQRFFDEVEGSLLDIGRRISDLRINPHAL